MQPVTQQFLDAIAAPERTILARAIIDYTDPFLDQSIAVATNELANVSYPGQTADGVAEVPHRWASLDGSWLLDGTYRLAPPSADADRYQFGWWGRQLAGTGGAFAMPYPLLTVTHFARPVHDLRVVGDTARQEWPVDFIIRLYGPANLLLHTETVTGNNQVTWARNLVSPILDVVRQEFEVSRWSHAGRQVKVIEFLTSVQQTYEVGDLLAINLLEEREVGSASLPVGAISANEIAVRLRNDDRQFDTENTQSPLYRLLKPNRRLQAWLGVAIGSATSPPQLSGYTKRRRITIDRARIDTSLSDVPVLVRLRSTNFDFSQSMANGYDVRFTAADGVTLLAFERERHDQANQVAEYYVRVPLISNTADTVLFVYFRLDATPNGASPTAVWDSNTVGRWALSEDPAGSAPQMRDSTANALHGATAGAMTAAQSVEGQVGRALFFAGTDDQVNLGDVPQLSFERTQPYTISAWVRTTFAGHQAVFAKMSSHVPVTNAHRGYDLHLLWNHVNAPNKLVPRATLINVHPTNSLSVSAYAAPNLRDGLWHHVVVTYDGSCTPGGFRIYVDGVEQILTTDVATLTETTITTAPVTIGSKATNLFANGTIDDVEVHNIARTAAWSRAKFASGNDTLVSVGPVETVEYVPLGTFWSTEWQTPDDTVVASIVARDRLELLRKSTYQSAVVLQNASLYALAEAVLQDAGLKPNEYAIDNLLQTIMIPWAWFEPMSHREALRLIAEAAMATVYADRDGVVRITPFAASGTVSVLQIGPSQYFRADNPMRPGAVANEVIVETQPLRPVDAPQEVHRSNEPITVPAGQTVAVTAHYNERPVIQAVGGLEGATNTVIQSAVYYGWGAEVVLHNVGAQAEAVTLVIAGRPLKVLNRERAVARDETSITDLGVLRCQAAVNSLVQTRAVAQALADLVLASARDPRRDLELDWRGNPALELGDRITSRGGDYHVIRNELDWTGGLRGRTVGRAAAS